MDGKINFMSSLDKKLSSENCKRVYDEKSHIDTGGGVICDTGDAAKMHQKHSGGIITPYLAYKRLALVISLTFSVIGA